MKPINNLAFNNICLDFSCSCMNFCSEATYITLEEIAHECNPIHYEEDEVENNFIENIVLKIYKMVMNKEDFKEYEFTVPTAKKNGSSDEVQYVNSNDVTFTGFKHFKIKVVMLSTSSSNVPRIRDFRAIALQI